MLQAPHSTIAPSAANSGPLHTPKAEPRSHVASWSRLASGAGLAGMLHVAGVSANLLVNILLARWLTTDSFGLYAFLLNQATLLATIAGLGLPLAILRYLPQYLSQNKREQAQTVIAHFWSISRVSALALTALVLVILSAIHFVSPIDHVACWFAAALLAGLLALANFQLELARATRRLTLAYLPLRVLWPVLTVISLGLVFAYGVPYDPLFVLISTVLVLAALLVWQAGFLQSRLKLKNVAAATLEDRQEWRSVSNSLWLLAVGSSLLATADVVAVGFCLSEEDVAVFFAAKRFAALVVLGQFAINAFAAPLISTLHHADKKQELQTCLRRASAITFSSSLVIGIGLFLFGDRLLGFFGADFTRGHEVMTWLVLSQLVNASTGASGSLLNVAGQHKKNATIVVGSALLQTIAAIGLALTVGLWGAGLATVVSSLLRNIALARLAKKSLGVDTTVFSNFLRDSR